VTGKYRERPDGTIINLEIPDRAIKQCLFGWALYQATEENGGEYKGTHVGFTDGWWAKKWLDGLDLKNIDHYVVYKGDKK